MPELPRPLRVAGLGVLILFVLAAPLLLPSYPLFVLSLGLVYTVAILGVNLVMGYAGQVSLGHAGFAAIGAYATALLINDAGFSYWAALPIGGLLAGAFGYLLGFPALRLGPLYVAMVTFGFGLVVMLVAQNWYELTNGPNGIVLMPPTLLGRDLLAPRFHYVVAVVTIGMYVLAHNIVHSAKGRAFTAIRESELAAQAMGVHLAHYKTMAFALGAFYAGISGGLFAGLAQFVNPDAFVFMVSILYVTMGILGGMGYLAGPAIGGITMAAVPELLRGSAEYKDFLTGLLLLLLLIFLPRGLMGLLAKFRRTGVAEAMEAPKVDLAPFDEPRTQAGPTLLEVERLTIRFGGLTALSDVSFSVNSGEILGLIGPNGAGKTTLFNLVSGVYRPTSGRVLYEGQDISRLPPHRRTELRIARTFQNLELFEEMTVLENVLVGAHSTVNVTLAGAAVRRDRAAEADVRARAITLLGYVGLAQYAELPANSLPFGHQRLLEIARALAVGPRLLMLDEPSAGLSTAEMDFLMGVIRRIRADLGVTVVVIGHTMRLVMGLSDRIVVLDHGEKIAEGDPATVRGDRSVIEAYLGATHA